MDHLRHGLGDPRNDILFVGHQSGGTLGSDLLRYSDRPGGYVHIDGDRVDIRAKVHRLTGYSAHADQQGLVDWVHGMGGQAGRNSIGSWRRGREEGAQGGS